MHSARQIARLIALYADVAYIPDTFSTAFEFHQQWTIKDSRWLLQQLALLFEVVPLINAGILKFYGNTYAVCRTCKKELAKQLQDAAWKVVEEHYRTISVTREGRSRLLVDPTDVDETALIHRHVLTKTESRRLRADPVNGMQTIGLRAYSKALAEESSSILMASRVNESAGGITLTGSRANALMVQQLDSSLPEVGELQKWEASRATKLPWIRDLTLDQLLQLREEAAKALPRFRARMATAFGNCNVSGEDKVTAVINELREEALTVEQEIKALRLPGESRFRTLLGSVTVAAAVFGATLDPTTSAAVGLISALSNIHSANRADNHRRDTLTSRPGFVLLRSSDLNPDLVPFGFRVCG
jgi:hypothetical protein